MKSITKKFKVITHIDEEQYNRWKKHILLIYGIKANGANASIMDFNSKVFSEAMEKMMAGGGK